MKWQQLCVKQNARALNCLPCNCRNYTMFLTVVNPKLSGTALSTPQCSPHHPAALLDSLLPSTGLHSSSLGRYIYCIVSMSTSGKRLLLLLLSSSSSSHLKQLLNPFPPSLQLLFLVELVVLFCSFEDIIRVTIWQFNYRSVHSLLTHIHFCTYNIFNN